MAVTQQMRNDWSNYWGNSKSGDIQAWGNGFLERNADGTATYKSNNGGATNFNAGMSIDDFAKSSKEIGNVLYNNYGYTDAQDTAAFPKVDIKTSAPAVAAGSVSDDMLVEKRLNGLLDANNPLIQQARARAAQTANSRGLLNSALAAGMGEEAAISQALPIATTDAGTFFKQSLTNQDAQNNANIAGANAANNAAIASAGYQSQAQLAQMNNAAASERLTQQGQIDSQLIDKKAAVTAADRQGEKLWQLGGDYINKSLTTQSWAADKITAIQSSNMTAEEKQGAIAQINATASTLQASVNAVYSKIPGWRQEWLSVAQGGDTNTGGTAQSVVNSYWSSGKAGDAGAWGDGKIAHNGDGTATYTTKDGRNVALNRGMSLSDLAATDEEVRANLRNYGYGG